MIGPRTRQVPLWCRAITHDDMSDPEMEMRIAGVCRAYRVDPERFRNALYDLIAEMPVVCSSHAGPEPCPCGGCNHGWGECECEMCSEARGCG